LIQIQAALCLVGGYTGGKSVEKISIWQMEVGLSASSRVHCPNPVLFYFILGVLPFAPQKPDRETYSLIKHGKSDTETDIPPLQSPKRHERKCG
jgi:hypothetical protein